MRDRWDYDRNIWTQEQLGCHKNIIVGVYHHMIVNPSISKTEVIPLSPLRQEHNNHCSFIFVRCFNTAL